MGCFLVLNEVLADDASGDGADGGHGVVGAGCEGIEVGGIDSAFDVALGNHREGVHFHLGGTGNEHLFDGDDAAFCGGRRELCLCGNDEGECDVYGFHMSSPKSRKSME